MLWGSQICLLINGQKTKPHSITESGGLGERFERRHFRAKETNVRVIRRKGKEQCKRRHETRMKEQHVTQHLVPETHSHIRLQREHVHTRFLLNGFICS